MNAAVIWNRFDYAASDFLAISIGLITTIVWKRGRKEKKKSYGFSSNKIVNQRRRRQCQSFSWLNVGKSCVFQRNAIHALSFWGFFYLCNTFRPSYHISIKTMVPHCFCFNCTERVAIYDALLTERIKKKTITHTYHVSHEIK